MSGSMLILTWVGIIFVIILHRATATVVTTLKLCADYCKRYVIFIEFCMIWDPLPAGNKNHSKRITLESCLKCACANQWDTFMSKNKCYHLQFSFFLFRYGNKYITWCWPPLYEICGNKYFSNRRRKCWNLYKGYWGCNEIHIF